MHDKAPAHWGIHVFRWQRCHAAQQVRLVCDYLIDVLSDASFYKNECKKTKKISIHTYKRKRSN